MMTEAERNFEFDRIKNVISKHLTAIKKELPLAYRHVTLICRTDKPNQQIILSTKLDVLADIEALTDERTQKIL